MIKENLLQTISDTFVFFFVLFCLLLSKNFKLGDFLCLIDGYELLALHTTKKLGVKMTYSGIWKNCQRFLFRFLVPMLCIILTHNAIILILGFIGMVSWLLVVLKSLGYITSLVK